MAKLITSRIQHPVHTAAALKTKNPVLLKGEIVYESDTTLHKVEDGKTPWNNLPYVGGGEIVQYLSGGEYSPKQQPTVRNRCRKREME